MALFVQF